MAPDALPFPRHRRRPAIIALATGVALVVSGCGGSSGKDHTVTTLPPVVTTTTIPPVPPADIQIRPTLAATVVPCDASSVTPVHAPAGQPTVVVASTHGAPPCTQYRLGPAGLTQAGLSQSRPIPSAVDSTWVLNVSATAKSVQAANAMFNGCFHGDATCPPAQGTAHGQVVILVDGLVQATPVVGIANLALGSFQIAGLSQQKARDLSTAIG